MPRPRNQQHKLSLLPGAPVYPIEDDPWDCRGTRARSDLDGSGCRRRWRSRRFTRRGGGLGVVRSTGRPASSPWPGAAPPLDSASFRWGGIVSPVNERWDQRLDRSQRRICRAMCRTRPWPCDRRLSAPRRWRSSEDMASSPREDTLRCPRDDRWRGRDCPIGRPASAAISRHCNGRPPAP